jgi:hypothetical protein
MLSLTVYCVIRVELFFPFTISYYQQSLFVGCQFDGNVLKGLEAIQYGQYSY